MQGIQDRRVTSDSWDRFAITGAYGRSVTSVTNGKWPDGNRSPHSWWYTSVSTPFQQASKGFENHIHISIKQLLVTMILFYNIACAHPE
jgi:hypothetical protein